MDQEVNDTIEQTIDLLDEKAVLFFKPYRRSPKDNELIDENVNELLKKGIYDNLTHI